VKRLTESTVFERTFNDMEAVFEDNVIDYSPLGNIFWLTFINFNINKRY
jgi:hypothetical protein